MCYDYFPDLQIVFTGSSILDIYKGNADLSRRAVSYFMTGLSFREYLIMSEKIPVNSFTFKEILSNKATIPVKHPLPLYKKYLKKGYYPFFHETDYEQKLQNVINQTLENDIPLFARMNATTSRKLKQLLYIISQSVPFKPNINKIAENIDVGRNQIPDYLHYMQQAGLIMMLQSEIKSVNSLSKIEKIYLQNTNLVYALANQKADIGNLRETFFINQMFVNHKVLPSQKADFIIDGYTFEIGGKNKNQQQISGIKNAFVAKDDIEFGDKNVIPLWAFGLNY